MSKALVIKNADFSANKLTTIDFDEDIPCTGISFSTSSYSLTDYTPVTISCTVVPNNTTDTVTWASSNTSVATVNNGVVTPVGIGSATITATCGLYSATATVNVNIQYIVAYAAPARTKIYDETTPNIVTTGGGYTKQMTLYGSGAQASTYRSEKTSGASAELYAIKFPANTSKIRFSITEGKSSLLDSDGVRLVWTKDEWSGNSTFPYSIKPISQELINFTSASTVEKNVPSGADSLFANIMLDSVPSDYDATYSELGFTITFVAA